LLAKTSLSVSAILSMQAMAMSYRENIRHQNKRKLQTIEEKSMRKETFNIYSRLQQ
jgi:hypothetical protein